jgi:homoserine dehydrogenase
MGVSTLIDDGVMQRVHPCLVRLETAIAHVNGVNNVVVAEGDPIGQTVYQGPGAGEGPTASAVVADLCDVARGATSPILPPPADVPSTYLGMDGHEARYYVRLTVADEPGVMAAITAALRDEDLSIESLIQRSHAAGEPASVLLVTHETNEMKIRRSMERIGGLDVMAAAPVFIRIENL